MSLAPTRDSNAGSLLGLSDDILLSLFGQYLDPMSLALVGGTCHHLLKLSRTRKIWESHIEPFRSASELLCRYDSEASSELFGTLFLPRTPGWRCHTCCGALTVAAVPVNTNSEKATRRRCPCVCRRVRMPLHVLGFSQRRCGTSSLEGNFREMLYRLRQNFLVHLQIVDELPNFGNLSEEQKAEFGNVTMIILCTTEGPELSDTEQQGLIHFVQSGGTAIVSAFSNWSSYGHYNRRLVNWLGIQVVPNAHFDIRRKTRQISRLPIAPWESTPSFVNLGENVFKDVDAQDFKVMTSKFFPRGHPRTGDGQVFVCSNYHWIADRHHWDGGLFEEFSNVNRHLLLNLAASAATYNL